RSKRTGASARVGSASSPGSAPSQAPDGKDSKWSLMRQALAWYRSRRPDAPFGRAGMRCAGAGRGMAAAPRLAALERGGEAARSPPTGSFGEDQLVVAGKPQPVLLGAVPDQQLAAAGQKTCAVDGCDRAGA